VTDYLRRLGLFDASMVVIGGIIGGGIFLNPSIVAQRIPNARGVILTWIVGGAIALAGALCFAELGGRRPRAGGGYVYLRDAFGRLPAFLYGWTFLFIINAGGIAAIAVTFARYAAELIGLPSGSVAYMAVAAIVVLTAVNYLGVQVGAAVQNLFTVLKLAALGLLIVAGFSRMPESSSLMSGYGASAAVPVRTLGVALIPVLFSYGGWAHANNLGGEVKDGSRTLPRAIMLWMAGVIVTYLLANAAYLRALGVAGLAHSSAPASEVVHRAIGQAGSTLIGLGIVASTFGFVGVAIMTAPRILQMMAADGLMLPAVAALHPHYHTPHRALVVQGTWAVVLTLSGTYGQLLDYTVFGDWIFFGLIAATLFRYRARDRSSSGLVQDGDDARASYRVPWYPVLPGLFVLVCAYVVVSSIASNPANAGVGAGLIGLGVPVFLWHRRKSASAVDHVS
jgi:APA family basic amino acid/polyamine antiporter